MNKLTIGIDIGGTNTECGVIDEAGNVVIRETFPTPNDGDINGFIDKIGKTLRNLAKSVSLLNSQSEILGIGVGSPAANYYKGTIENASNLSFKGIIPFIDLMKKQFPEYKHIVLTNDANAAAIGEMIYGGAKNMRNFIVYTLGTGVGSGIVVNGDIVYGADSFAGELGHVMLVPNGRLCGCGAHGHLETYCSSIGMKRTAFELLAQKNCSNSLLAKVAYNDLTSKMIYDFAKQGDETALEVFRLTGFYLGMGLADTVHIFAPEAIFLFGGPVAAGDFLLNPTKESLEEHLLPMFKGKVKILPSQLALGNAAIVGASAMVVKEIEKSH